jgi:hypothetical protein
MNQRIKLGRVHIWSSKNMPDKSSHILLPLVILATTFTQSCRPSLREISQPGEPVTIEIRLANMNPTDKARKELLFTISGCGSAIANGTKMEKTNPDESTISYKTQNVIVGDRCDVQVLSNNADPTVSNWFDKAGLMYEAKRVEIKTSGGRLSGTAILQQLYTPRSKDLPTNTLWKLSSAVKGPKAVDGLCTCSLTSSPALANGIAKLELDADKSSGICHFINLIGPELSSVTFSKLSVQCSNQFFEGQWPSGTTANGSVASESKLPLLSLTDVTAKRNVDTVIEVTVPKK